MQVMSWAMFFRYKFTNSGKAIQLIESLRDPQGRPRQKIVLSLGDAAFPKAIWSQVAKEVSNRLRGNHVLADREEVVEGWINRVLRGIERRTLQTKTHFVQHQQTHFGGNIYGNSNKNI
jgi:hypothetical protein